MLGKLRYLREPDCFTSHSGEVKVMVSRPLILRYHWRWVLECRGMARTGIGARSFVEALRSFAAALYGTRPHDELVRLASEIESGRLS